MWPQAKFCEYLQFPLQKHCGDHTGIVRENTDIFAKLRLRPQGWVFKLWHRIEVQIAPSWSELFENQIFVAARNFYGNNFRRWNIDEKCTFSLGIMWLWSVAGRNFWGVAGRNFYNLFLLDLSFHWGKNHVHPTNTAHFNAISFSPPVTQGFARRFFTFIFRTFSVEISECANQVKMSRFKWLTIHHMMCNLLSSACW